MRGSCTAAAIVVQLASSPQYARAECGPLSSHNFRSFVRRDRFHDLDTHVGKRWEQIDRLDHPGPMVFGDHGRKSVRPS